MASLIQALHRQTSLNPSAAAHRPQTAETPQIPLDTIPTASNNPIPVQQPVAVSIGTNMDGNAMDTSDGSLKRKTPDGQTLENPSQRQQSNEQHDEMITEYHITHDMEREQELAQMIHELKENPPPIHHRCGCGSYPQYSARGACNIPNTNNGNHPTAHILASSISTFDVVVRSSTKGCPSFAQRRWAIGVTPIRAHKIPRMNHSPTLTKHTTQIHPH
jgi:hypothetical protein